jgi:hypothetical protein
MNFEFTIICGFYIPELEHVPFEIRQGIHGMGCLNGKKPRHEKFSDFLKVFELFICQCFRNTA